MIENIILLSALIITSIVNPFRWYFPATVFLLEIFCILFSWKRGVSKGRAAYKSYKNFRFILISDTFLKSIAYAILLVIYFNGLAAPEPSTWSLCTGTLLVIILTLLKIIVLKIENKDFNLFKII